MNRAKVKRTKSQGSVVTCESLCTKQEAIPFTTTSHTTESESVEVSSETIPAALPENYEWNRLDNYATIIQSHEEARTRDEKRAVQSRIKADLDKQMADIRSRKEREKRDDAEYYKNLSIEIEQWKEYDRRVAEDRRIKAEIEKLDRDEQLQYDSSKKQEQHEKLQREDQMLLQRIDLELKEEQREVANKKLREKELIKKLMEENERDRRAKTDLKRALAMDELRQLDDYTKLIEKQEREREAELAARVHRQKELIKRMEENVLRKIEEKSNDDNIRALKQQAERDARALEVESFRKKRLEELKQDMKDMLRSQVEEKRQRQKEESELKEIHAQILKLDTDEFQRSERERLELKKQLISKYKEQLHAQVESMKNRRMYDRDEMNQREIALNRDLIGVVERVMRDEESKNTSSS